MTTATKEATAADRSEEHAESPKCLAENLSWLLAQAHFALGREINSSFEPLGISNRAYHVLQTAGAGEFTQRELAELIGMDKTTMVVTIDELEEAGLAARLQLRHCVTRGTMRPYKIILYETICYGSGCKDPLRPTEPE